MKIDERVARRLQDLIDKGNLVVINQIEDKRGYPHWLNKEKDTSYYLTSSLGLLDSIFGLDNRHAQEFKRLADKYNVRQDVFDLNSTVGVLAAAKDDYENGYLFNTKSLIEAEVFDDFLEQAEQLFAKGYHAPAAVVAGCVLEDGLKNLCARNGITLDAKAPMNPTNDALAKQGVYNTLMQKKILAMADLRNKAAHGQWTQFTKEDVGDMIKFVRSFLETHYI